MLRIDHRSPVYPVDPGITLGEFERMIMGEPYEVVGVFGEDGRLVLAPKSGASDIVSFIQEEVPLLEGRCVTHNHPSGSVLSPEDAFLAAEHGLEELRAVCPEGTVYSLSRPLAGWPESRVVMAAAKRAWEAFPRENMRRKAANQPIIKGKDRHDWMFGDQRAALASLGVRLRRSDVWQR